MSLELQNLAIAKFFEFYSSDLVSESVDENNIVISFPVHFSGFHRVEITVTRVNPSLFIISDGSRTIEELKSSGYPINTRLKKRLEIVSRSARIRVVNNYLIAESDAQSLGSSIQRFIEAAKTIGDAYLVQRAYPPRDTNLINQVSDFLSLKQVPYQRKHTLRGKVEDHTVDFYFPPNGVPGLALSVMNNPTHINAQAWAFKSGDIKAENFRTKIGIVYDSEEEIGKSVKAILQHSADVAVPSSDMQILQSELREIGILKNG
jgi:hypothetical protein